MEIKIDRLELLKIINIVEKGLPQKTVIESLKGISIDAKNDRLVFTTSKTDLVIEYVCTENFEIVTPGVIIIPGSQFTTIVKKTSEDSLLIKSDGAGVLLQTSKSKINLMEYEVSSYPFIKFDTTNLPAFNLTTKELAKIYNHTKHSVSINSIKPILTGINVKLGLETMTAGSTDARRLSISSFDMDGSYNQSNSEVSFTIPRVLLSDLTKIIESAHIEKFELFVGQNQLVVVSDNLKIKTRLLEGEYPSIERLVPQKEVYSYVLNTKELSSILEKVTMLSERDGCNITAVIENDNLILTSYIREIGSIEEICSLKELNGTAFPISFDPRFLMDSVSAIGESELELKMVDEISAFSITGLKNKKHIQVISPIKLS